MLIANAHDDRAMIRHSRYLLGLAVRRLENNSQSRAVRAVRAARPCVCLLGFH